MPILCIILFKNDRCSLIHRIEAMELLSDFPDLLKKTTCTMNYIYHPLEEETFCMNSRGKGFWSYYIQFSHRSRAREGNKQPVSSFLFSLYPATQCERLRIDMM